MHYYYSHLQNEKSKTDADQLTCSEVETVFDVIRLQSICSFYCVILLLLFSPRKTKKQDQIQQE